MADVETQLTSASVQSLDPNWSDNTIHHCLSKVTVPMTELNDNMSHLSLREVTGPMAEVVTRLVEVNVIIRASDCHSNANACIVYVCF